MRRDEAQSRRLARCCLVLSSLTPIITFAQSKTFGSSRPRWRARGAKVVSLVLSRSQQPAWSEGSMAVQQAARLKLDNVSQVRTHQYLRGIMTALLLLAHGDIH